MELQEEATIRNFLIVQKEGSRNVSRETKHYNLQAIIAAALAKEYAESEFEKYRIIQDRLYKSDFDKFLELENIAENKHE